MKWFKYIKDYRLSLLVFFLVLILVLLFLLAFKVDVVLSFVIVFLFLFAICFHFIWDYRRKSKFYDRLQQNIDALDQKYLALETIEVPTFYEGERFYEMSYEMNKSMIENINQYRLQVIDFKDYIEMWIHEVKIPLSSLTLHMHNQKTPIDGTITNQLRRIDDCIEQVLYYVRCENAEKDYLIKPNSLQEMIHQVLVKNKDLLLESKIEVEVGELDKQVLTDRKWMEFILNQVINNSIKYQKKDGKDKIIISARQEKKDVTLSIEDHGIGILETDLPNVFQKSFTGQNGRIRAKSTGMGLYIAKSLCSKLGHTITIFSKPGQYTRVEITYTQDPFYAVVR